MQRWTRLRALRMIGAIFALSLMLSACDASDVLDLLDGIAQEQGGDDAAPETPDKGSQPDDSADTDDSADADDDAAAPDKPEAPDYTDDDPDADTPAKPEKPQTPSDPAEPDAPSDDEGDTGSGDLSDVEQEIFDTLNATREDADLNPLTLSAEISAGAREYSCVMAETGQFKHADLRSAGVNGENIAYGYRGAADVHEGWMGSPGHHDNRMSGSWSEYGVGVCDDADGTPYYTERFR